jgi:hypothetical protein
MALSPGERLAPVNFPFFLLRAEKLFEAQNSYFQMLKDSSLNRMKRDPVLSSFLCGLRPAAATTSQSISRVTLYQRIPKPSC